MTAVAVEDHPRYGATTDSCDKLKIILVFDGLVTSFQLAIPAPHGFQVRKTSRSGLKILLESF